MVLGYEATSRRYLAYRTRDDQFDAARWEALGGCLEDIGRRINFHPLTLLPVEGRYQTYLPGTSAQFAGPVVIAPIGLSKLLGGGPEWEQETDDPGCAIDPIDHEGAPCKFAGGNADKLAVQPLC